MKIKVLPCEAERLQGAEHSIGIVSSGYESRGRFAWEQLGLKAFTKIALLFPDHRVLDFDRNRTFFAVNGFSEVAVTQAAVRAAIRDALSVNPDAAAKTPLSVVVDISCMTRLLIAATCYELVQAAIAVGRQVIVDFVYSCAVFGKVPGVTGPISVNGPAIAALGGWPRNPSAPLGVIIGVGYEEDLALGVIEELEATNVWAFRPKDHDPRYEAEIDSKNRGLFEEISVSNTVRYSVFDAFSLYSSLEALIGLAKRDSRLLVVPLGPKIFALVSSLAVLRHLPDVGLWRVSNGENLTPVDRCASGKIVTIQAVFDPT